MKDLKLDAGKKINCRPTRICFKVEDKALRPSEFVVNMDCDPSKPAGSIGSFSVMRETLS
jgi:hypothetical protein